MISDTAFILAAGFGKRLRPYTDDKPKPMVTVGGRTLIDHTIDQLKNAGIQNCLINTHYKGEVLADHLQKRADMHITTLHEDIILDTGGGVKNALPAFKGQDFFLLNGDGLWTNAPAKPALERMKEAWNPQIMDILLLLQPINTMKLTAGVGDYTIAPADKGKQSARAVRSLDQSGTHMFTGIRITSSGVFDNAPDGAFSYLPLMDEAQAKGRLFALEHDGMWHHISTPADLEAVNADWNTNAAHNALPSAPPSAETKERA